MVLDLQTQCPSTSKPLGAYTNMASTVLNGWLRCNFRELGCKNVTGQPENKGVFTRPL